MAGFSFSYFGRDYAGNSVSSANPEQIKRDFNVRQRGVQHLRVFTKMDRKQGYGGKAVVEHAT